MTFILILQGAKVYEVKIICKETIMHYIRILSWIKPYYLVNILDCFHECE